MASNLPPIRPVFIESDEELEDILKELNEKQQKFCWHYAYTGDSKKALTRAGYRPKTHAIHDAVRRLRKNEAIRRYTGHLKAILKEEANIEAVDLINQLKAIAQADITDFMPEGYIDFETIANLDVSMTGAIQRIKRDKEGNIEIVLGDKLQAIKQLVEFFNFDPETGNPEITEYNEVIIRHRMRPGRKTKKADS